MNNITTKLFIATERFDPSDREAWGKYCDWSQIPGLTEIVSLDITLCPPLIHQLKDEDWRHNVHEDFRLHYFYDLDYLRDRVQGFSRRNILGLYRNPTRHISDPPAAGGFEFIGYDLTEEQTQISALTNCGGFPDVFRNEELNQFGLIGDFDRAAEIRRLLPERNPNEPHAKCELYAIWRLNE